jgi:hypothetical protein
LLGDAKQAAFALTFPDEFTLEHPWKEEKKPRSYQFDACFGGNTSQEEIFEDTKYLVQVRACGPRSEIRLERCDANRTEPPPRTDNEAQRPHHRGVRVALGTGYTHVAGIGRASRNGRVPSATRNRYHCWTRWRVAAQTARDEGE